MAFFFPFFCFCWKKIPFFPWKSWTLCAGAKGLEFNVKNGRGSEAREVSSWDTDIFSCLSHHSHGLRLPFGWTGNLPLWKGKRKMMILKMIGFVASKKWFHSPNHLTSDFNVLLLLEESAFSLIFALLLWKWGCLRFLFQSLFEIERALLLVIEKFY